MYATPFPFQIFQTPDRVLFVFEGATHIWRQIVTDGRPHAADPNPSFLGDAVGHWEGDTLVVDTIGFNGKTWLDQTGKPTTEALHVTERYRRKSFGTMEIQITIDDPKAYTKPWTVTEEARLMASGELYEFICNENNRDLDHLPGDSFK